MAVQVEPLKFRASNSSGDASAIVMRPPSPTAVYVLVHGAAACMRHAFMEDIAGRLAGHGIATFRYQFPYIENGRKRPDPPGILHQTVRSAVEAARKALPGVPMIAGGKSMGGRMTSLAASKEALGGVDGIVFLGFPLHAPGRHDASRGEHLFEVRVPMLFIQGTRDALADLELLRPVCERLGARATLHIVEGGDHSFKVLKRSGRSQEEVMEEIVGAIRTWAIGRLGN